MNKFRSVNCTEFQKDIFISINSIIEQMYPAEASFWKITNNIKSSSTTVPLPLKNQASWQPKLW